MLWILIFIGAVTLALARTFNTQFIRAGGGGQWSPAFVMGGNFLGVGFYLSLVWLVLAQFHVVHFPTTVHFWLPLILTILLNIIFEVLLFKAYALTDLALISPFAALSPLLTIVSSLIILKEIPSVGGLIGIICIVTSIYCMHVRGAINVKNILAPVTAIWQNRGTRYAFLASIPPAISIVFDKQAVAASDPITFSCLAVIFIGLGAWGVDLVEQGSTKFKKQFVSGSIGKFFRISFFQFISTVAFNSTLLLTLVPYVSALRRSVIVFEILFGYLLLGQRSDIRRRLFAGVGIVCGVILIALFK